MTELQENPRIRIIDVGPGHAGLLSILAAQDKTGRTIAIDIESWGPGIALNPFEMLRDENEKQVDIDRKRFSRTRVRKYLARHGLRGEALRNEVVRITRGYYDHPHDINETAQADDSPVQMRFPYGWPKSAMTRLMRRMFHRHGTPELGLNIGKFWNAFARHRPTQP